jgi:peptide/nickel transport system permease protein
MLPLTRAHPTPATAKAAEPSLLRRLLWNRSGSVGLLLVVVYSLIAIMGLLNVTPYPSLEAHTRDRLKPPSQTYLMGTDLLGRDIASRLMVGATNSLRVALLSVAISAMLGTLIGTVSGYIGGLFDNILMRVMDVFFALPALLLALVIVSIFGSGLTTTVAAIATVYTPIFARVARGPVLAVKQLDFITAARCLGMSNARIVFRHILPNTLAPLVVQVSLALSWSLLTEAGLSFLGLGTQPPAPSWGVMLSESRGISEIAPWLMIYPALAIMFGVLGFNLLGDGLRDVLDPRLRGMKSR